MEILYRAGDGRIFETEEDCAYHETLLEIGDKPCAIFADWRGHVFTLKDALNHESGYSPESVMYMFAANSDLWACARDYLFEPYGIECPDWDMSLANDEPQAWFYDESYGGWKTWESKVKDYFETKEIFDKMMKRG